MTVLPPLAHICNVCLALEKQPFYFAPLVTGGKDKPADETK